MTDNTSEVDQITGETSRFASNVYRVITSWRLMNPDATRVPRSVRREINRLIKADIQEREFAHAQERVRIERSLIEHRWNLLHNSAIRPWDTTQIWFERQRQLGVDHERLRERIHTTTYLTATERGQATQTLTQTHRDPYTPITAVFDRPRGIDALRARLHDGFTRLRAGLASPTEQQQVQRWHQQRRERAGLGARGLDPADPLLHRDPNQPINLVPVEMPAPGHVTAAQPQVTLRDLTERINLYRDALNYRRQYAGEHLAEMKSVDEDNAHMRSRILADARSLGPDQATLVETALLSIDQVHQAPPDRARQDGPADQDPTRTAQVQHGDAARAAADLDNRHKIWRIEVRSNPAPADPSVPMTIDSESFTTPTEALLWAEQKLADHGSHAAVRLYPKGIDGQEQSEPVYKVAGRTDIVAAQLVDDARAQNIDRENIPNSTPPAPGGVEPAPTEPGHGYEVTVGSAEFLRAHPEMANRAEFATLAEGYTWALDQLGDDSKGWPADADVVANIHRHGDPQPLHAVTGHRSEAIDKVITWQETHETTPLAKIEQLQSELRAAHAEIGELRTENTEMVRKFAENSPTQSVSTSSGIPVMPTGPRLTNPIFTGPVLTQSLPNGLDR
ncbi:hypothetical protein [Nocardia sp. NPDC059228]|uniref:hypothetical protein n=1 Tax=Nocardia sp. NPDC059228 TaxID=3346777 RepID=UPI00367CC056